MKYSPEEYRKHKRKLERIRLSNPAKRAHKNARHRKLRLNPEYKAREKVYCYFYERERRESQPGFIEQQRERMLKRLERQEAKKIYEIKLAEWKAKRLEREGLKALKPVRVPRFCKPIEIKGLNALDYPRMTLDQRKAWNKWTYQCYAEQRADRCRRWRRQNPEKVADRNRAWNQANKEKIKIYRRNPKHKISCNAHRRIKDLCKGIKIESASILRGCSSMVFYKHIEKRFYGGMTWDNYGEVWELDHIKPVSAFDLAVSSERLTCGNFMNLQPLLINHNISKGDRLGTFIQSKTNLFDREIAA